MPQIPVNQSASPYSTLVLGQMPRLLSQIDRNPFSPTYGCGDRAYWHYRTMTDYAAPLHQEVALTLALVWQQQRDGNPYWQSESLCEIACAVMRFWCTLQQGDGSFPEFYPAERSFVATAFTGYAISETLLILGGEVERLEREKLLVALSLAADWLHRHRDIKVVNHTAGAIAMLQNMKLLTSEPRYDDYRAAKVEDLLDHQHEEGWFYEYGGADLAYLSMSVDYLAKDYRHSRDERLGQALAKALDFMRHFLHPDGSFGGEYGSRNGKYLMPHGLELLAAEMPAAAQLARAHAAALTLGKVLSPASMDDRYTAFFLNKYAAAWADQATWADPAEEMHRESRFFPGAGLLVQANSASYTIIALSKHGVIKSYSSGEATDPKALYSDTGYFAEFADGTVGHSQWLDLDAEYKIWEEGETMNIEVVEQMAHFNTTLPLVRNLIPFRLFTKVMGRFSRFMDWFGSRVIKRMIIDRRLLPVHLLRHIRLESGAIVITDRLELLGGKRLVRLGRSVDGTAIHVASSRYAQEADREVPGAWDAPAEFIGLLNRGQAVEVVTRVEFGSAEGNPMIEWTEQEKKVAVA